MPAQEAKAFISLQDVQRTLPTQRQPDYTAIQSHLGIVDKPVFPPVTKRVAQKIDPFAPFRSPRRVTDQANDLCNLACEGCYVGEWLTPGGVVFTRNDRKQVPWEQHVAQMNALGPAMEEYFLLGAEPTMTPDFSRKALADARGRGLKAMAVTNGATRPGNFDRTFAESGPEGLSKLNISIDSMDSNIHDLMRGRTGALAATLENLDRYVAMGYPVKAQMTVFPINYATILDSVADLYTKHGVRRFAFHCGSLEGVSDAKRKDLEHVDPIAWRALVEQLYLFRTNLNAETSQGDRILEFNVPYIFFTEAEIRDHVIGEEPLATQYFEHVDAVANGVEKPLPFVACPKVTVEDPYLFANDGPESVGRLVSCQILTGGYDNMHHAQFDPEAGEFVVNQDPATSELSFMVKSPHLCPAMPTATGGNTSDRVMTERGPMYHGCRYTSVDQMPFTPGQFPHDDYEGYATMYEKIADARVRSSLQLKKAKKRTVQDITS